MYKLASECSYLDTGDGGAIVSGALVTARSAAEVYGTKTLGERLAGRFYTPDILSSDLAQQMLKQFTSARLRGSRVRIMDPFCGDGRLVVALLVAIGGSEQLRASTWHITLIDQERAAVAVARATIEGVANALRLDVTIAADVRDTFASAGEMNGNQDLIITNPPWELLKPDSRETAHMTAAEVADYRARLRSRSDQLDARFPDARASNAWAGWGTNLARCGWDYCIRASRKGGVVGIILPSTLLGDQSSTRLRQTMFDSCRVADIAAYPAEARLFERVDQSVVALTLVKGAAKQGGQLRLFDADRTISATLSMPSRAELEAQDYCVPVGFGAQAQRVMRCVAQHAPISALEGREPSQLWMGRELDETRIAEKTVRGLARPFVKGRMVARHRIVEQPSQSVRAQLSTRLGSIDKPRAVWRDVARASQRRRMIGTVIPPGWVAGNSLHVACFNDGDLERTKGLHAILSSFVLEFQVRSRLATGHMSLGVVRTARAPAFAGSAAKRLSALVDDAMNGDCGAGERLEIAVAKSYGLSRGDMDILVDSFPKIDVVEKERLMARQHWDKI